MEEVDSVTFAQWKVFNAVDPEGVERGDWHNAAVLAMLRNANRSPDSSPSVPKDFVVDMWSNEARDKLLNGTAPKTASPKETLDALRGIPGVTITVFKPEAIEQ